MKITREIKKAEAINRMKAMDIIPEAIRQFEEDDIINVSENPYGMLYWVNDTQKQLIADFELEYDALVYLCNYCVTEFGRLLSLFYVSDYEEEYDMDNGDIKECCACVYCVNLDCPDFSEFGTIGFQSMNGGIIRKW